MAIRVKKHVPSGTIILDRPQRKNALTRQMLEDLQQALTDLHQERKVRAVILTGAGDCFSSGIDLTEMNETRQSGDSLQQWYDEVVLFRDVLELMLRYPKPIVAAVSGPALGAGAALLLACDVVVAASDATFGLPEARRGLVAGLAAPLLAFRVGGGWSANLLMTGEVLSAEKAQRIGVFHEVVTSNVVWARAQQMCEMISESAPEALQMTRRLVNETIGEALFTALSSGAAATATARTTEAAAEGLTAFHDKRLPQWP
ncbi:MAG: enoyl-CoA hydratase/isomerase family protein [Pirellulales bacterium]